MIASSAVTNGKLASDAVTTVKIANSAVTNAKLAGSITNAKLANSSITINGQAVALGGSVTISSGSDTLYDLAVTEAGGAVKLKLDASSGDDDEVTITGSTGITVARVGAEELSITNSSPNVTTNLTATQSGNTVTVNSSDGNNATLAVATTTNAGVMSTSDKSKLDGIAASATNTAAPAITTDGSTPSLASGISQLEVRNAIGAGTSNFNAFTLVDAATAQGTINSGGSQLTLADSSKITLRLSGTGNKTLTADLVNSGVSAATYGANNTVPVFAVNAKGLITSVTNTAIANLPGTAIASGTINNARLPNTIGNDDNTEITFDGSDNIKFLVDNSENMRLAGTALHVEGDVVAFSTTVSSDEKLKEDIHRVEGALELVSQLDGVKFKWKKNGIESAGVIAQNVQEVLPSAVKEVDDINDVDKHLNVDYNQLSALFIEAIKELKEENKQLRSAIEELKDINNNS